MKHYLITLFTRLYEAIKRGILRIFPLPQKVLYITLALSALLLIGCATPKQTAQMVRDIQRDTIYVSNHQYDSVYVFKDKITDRSRDTLYIREVQTEYKYRVLRDTILKVQRDSIPYEVTKIVTKEIQRPLTPFDRLCRICFFFLAGVLFVLFVRFVFKIKKSIYG